MNRDTLLEDVFAAYYDARKNKRNTKSQLAFEINLETNLIELYHDIQNRTYHPMPSVCFVVHKPVKREVFASQFRDRVVHHLLYNYIAPIFEKRFIYDSYSCRKGKGTLFGIKRLEHHIRSCSENYTKHAYVLKLDLRGYFMSINKQRLYDVVAKVLKRSADQIDAELVDFLLRTIIFKDPTQNCIFRGDLSNWTELAPSKSLFKAPKGVGLPIGDLTSQLFSNIYMGEFDLHIKREMRVKHYGRYVDDFYIVHRSRQFLKQLIVHIDEYLCQTLELKLHPDKIYLQHVSKGIQFLGAVVKPHRRYASIRCMVQFRLAMRLVGSRINPATLGRCRATVNSYCGYLGQHRTWRAIKEQLSMPCEIRKYLYFDTSFSRSMLLQVHKTKLCKMTQIDAQFGVLLNPYNSAGQ